FSPAELLLMDEPFRGLDRETKQSCIRFLHKYRRGRLLVVSAHDESDAEALEASVWRLHEGAI
ncbi:MAG: ABC transporter ATP-binding protein, partial [Lachnospiraceae bacterium]|nr:ABC transporter ATP-binding protein [Lachnospiraceae bacterium]